MIAKIDGLEDSIFSALQSIQDYSLHVSTCVSVAAYFIIGKNMELHDYAI